MKLQGGNKTLESGQVCILAVNLTDWLATDYCWQKDNKYPHNSYPRIHYLDILILSKATKFTE